MIEVMDDIDLGQPVRLTLDVSGDILDCVVAAHEGEATVLVQTVAASPEVTDQLRGGTTGLLMLEEAHAVLGFRGAIIAPAERQPLIEFVPLN